MTDAKEYPCSGWFLPSHSGEFFIPFSLPPVVLFQTDLLSFVGLRQIFKEEESGSLITKGLYQFVRHPLYTFSLLILWFSPGMSLNSLIVYSALTIYVLIGIIFEERKLLREFGETYEKYRSMTPMLIPGLNFIWNK